MSGKTERQLLLEEIRRLRGELDAIINAALNGSDDVDDETEEEDNGGSEYGAHYWAPANIVGTGYVPTGYGKKLSYFTCTKCGIEKPLDRDHFHINTSTSTGFTTHCAECRREDQSIWQTKDMKRIRQLMAKRLQEWRPKTQSAKRYTRVIVQDLIDAGYEIGRSKEYKQSELPYDEDGEDN